MNNINEHKNCNNKKQWSDEERLQLANKLDNELEKFLNGLEKKRYEEGWPEHKWQEEMDKHPFFMKTAPLPGDEIHPLFEGLQNLKYDPSENTKEELANNYKDDGNFYMKHKKFRMAVYSYTEGLQVKCDKCDVVAVLYNNRSAAHFFLKNYRSALCDAQEALKYKPDYCKAKLRAAQCAYFTNQFELCSKLCGDLSLEMGERRDEIRELLRKNKSKELQIKRNRQKEQHAMRKREQKFQILCKALKLRRVKFNEMDNIISKELIQPRFLPLENFPVHFDEENDNILIWPAAFSYPEFLYSDFQQQLSEEATMLDALKCLFAEPLPFDKFNIYSVNSVNVYYENCRTGKAVQVNIHDSIKKIVQEQDGSLLFYIVPKESEVEAKYLKQPKRKPIVYD